MQFKLRLFCSLILVTCAYPAWAQIDLPVADAGPDLNVEPDTPVTLDGSGSSDPTNTGLAYLWKQIAGLPVALDDPTLLTPSFIAPADPTVLTFQLTVDNRSNMASDTVDITVKSLNNIPVADAGDDFTIRGGATAQLDGSGSFDLDGDPITYQWIQTGLPRVLLSNENAVNPTFIAPFENVVLEFQLIVSDGTGRGLPDSIVVSVINANETPVANAGRDLTVDEFTQVTLDGSASFDPDGDGLSYRWRQTSGLPVSLQFPQTASPVFTAPSVTAVTQELVFELIVTDDYPYEPKHSLPDEVSVFVQDINAGPNCDAAFPSLSALWPPNHKLVEVSINGLTDRLQPVSINIHSVTQDEPVVLKSSGDDKRNKRKKRKFKSFIKKALKYKASMRGDVDDHNQGIIKKWNKKKLKVFLKKVIKNKSRKKKDDDDAVQLAHRTSPDAVIMDQPLQDTVLIRAERFGNGNGRVYLVNFTASNAGGSCVGSVNVAVPHHRGSEAIDDGQLHDSTQRFDRDEDEGDDDDDWEDDD